MTLAIRKLIVLVLIASVFLLANLCLVVNWLTELGVVDCARHIRQEYVTGTAITVIITLLIVIVAPRAGGTKLLRRCPVCDQTLLGRSKYCSDCGSKV